MNEHRTCEDCLDYMFRRAGVLMPALAVRMRETGETTEDICDRYMRGVHARHLSGLPLLAAS